MNRNIFLILFITLVVLMSLNSCYHQPTETDKEPTVVYRLETENEYNDEYYIDTNEKHFDCVVNEAIIERRDNPPYAYITECGILFYSDVKYKVGDVIENFKSGKHK